MAGINADVELSPAWWLKKLSTKLDAERPGFEVQQRYFDNDPPTYDSLLHAKAADDPSRPIIQDFIKRSRSNFASLVVESVREKMLIRGFNTAADSDRTGDAEALQLWKRAGMGVISTEVHQWMLTMSRAYVIVGDVDPETEAPIITAEDPRQMTAYIHPARPNRVVAALKMFQDEMTERKYAYLYLDGKNIVWEQSNNMIENFDSNGKITIGAMGAWKINDNLSRVTNFPPPVTAFVNRHGKGEYETLTDILDRINFMVLQRIMVAAVQAFKQRALKNAPTHYPDDYPDESLRNTLIDYTKIFFSSPDAFWLLPKGVDDLPIDIWESAAVDLTPLLSACKDDLVHLSAISRTPLHYLNPESANQSAEGASLIREGFISRTDDRILRASPSWARVMSQAFKRIGDPRGNNVAALNPLWRDVEQIPLSERASAAAQLNNIVPFPTLMVDVMGFNPDDLPRLEQERQDERLLLAAVQMAEQVNAQKLQEKTIKATAEASAKTEAAKPAEAKEKEKTPNVRAS